ncbi:hypothetical protein D3C78_1891260 [compost metagenome]
MEEEDSFSFLLLLTHSEQALLGFEFDSPHPDLKQFLVNYLVKRLVYTLLQCEGQRAVPQNYTVVLTNMV